MLIVIGILLIYIGTIADSILGTDWVTFLLAGAGFGLTMIQVILWIDNIQPIVDKWSI